jgi:hypothetical protein
MNPTDFDDNYQENIETAESTALDDIEDGDSGIDTSSGSIVSFVQEKLHKAEDARRVDENRWMQAYRNYRGLYSPEVRFTEAERSRIFVKVTKTKTLAAYGQIVDVMFSGQKFPISVDATTLPDGVVESVHAPISPEAEPAIDALKEAFSPFSGEEDSMLRPGETMPQLTERLGGLTKRLEPLKEKLIEGVGATPTDITFYPAEIAAKKMQKKIHDQLEESGATKQLRLTAFETALFGTGIMKGPFAVNKEYPKWDDSGDYTPKIKVVPSTSHVSIWNFYPDPDAANMDDAEYVIERHKMSRSQLRALKGRPFFRDGAIDTALSLGESYVKKWWEQAMEDDGQGSTAERYEVKEFWGYVDTEVLELHDIDIPEELVSAAQVNVNIWVCNGQVLRLVMNPFKPALIPYYAVPYEINPYSFFGVGIAENMDDTQTLMNGFMRMAVDNAVLSGNLLIEVDETNLVPGQDLSVYPGKVFRRQGGAPGQAIFGTKFPNVASENMQLFDKARVLADESTGFPSFAHGQTGVTGVGRTASGISMLMSAANGSIKNVIKNIDDYLLAPLGKAFFSFNMQFDYDPEIKGDLEVSARGTSSLMANEVRSQRLMQFLQVIQNPVLAPFAKMDYLIREIATSMELDPEKVTNSLQDAAIQAEILKGFKAPTPPPGVGPDGSALPAPTEEAAAGPPGPQDTSGGGGGNIGMGSAPAPTEPGFSGNIQ